MHTWPMDITRDALQTYLDDVVEQYKTGHAREDAYRPAFRNLFASNGNVTPVNDPKHSEFGAPDFIFLRKDNSDIVVGYAETKDLGANLDKVERTNQMERYRGYANLILSNYLEFRFYTNGERVYDSTIAHIHNGAIQADPSAFAGLISAIRDFQSSTPELIRNGRRLSEIMGAKARRIRDNVQVFMKTGGTQSKDLEQIFSLMKNQLVHDLDASKFSDMYAQTLVYGLFAARYSTQDALDQGFTRITARDMIPRTNPFLRSFFDHIAGTAFEERLARTVNELCESLAISDIPGIAHTHVAGRARGAEAQDPVIHFYEDFLKSYDPIIRRNMGAYYTPAPLVKFIVREVDRLLKQELGIRDGLADASTTKYRIAAQPEKGKKRAFREVTGHRVQILDPATGTGTFLNEIVLQVHDRFANQAGRWPSYAQESLIPRLFGFELMMAPYTISHVKLATTLRETGIENLDARLNVFLTNSLDEAVPTQPDLFTVGLTAAVGEESRLASEVKDERPVMVVLGNPPWKGESNNKTAFAKALVERYRIEPGGKSRLQERNPKWLGDDYVKFLAFSERMIERNDVGIVGMVSNNGYIDNPTFRGMRWRLTQTFDAIYVLNLHGSLKKRDIAEDGTRDENVFDIEQGVAIILAVKRKDEATAQKNKKRRSNDASVYYAGMTGSRRSKFESLVSGNVDWTSVSLNPRTYSFRPTDQDGTVNLSDISIPLTNLFRKRALGFQTHRDAFAIARTSEDMATRMNMLADPSLSTGTLLSQLGITGLDPSKIDSIRDAYSGKLYSSDDMQEVLYRIGDKRSTLIESPLSDRPRDLFKRHVVGRNNVLLGVGRQGLAVGNGMWSMVWASNLAMDANVFRRGGITAFPLYLYEKTGEQVSNMDREQIRLLVGADLNDRVSDRDVLHYIYGVLHSTGYREYFAESLRTDFPLIPCVKSEDEFWRFSQVGSDLLALHLFGAEPDAGIGYPIAGRNDVASPHFTGGHLFVNDAQYFDGIPKEVWEMEIGGGSPLQQYLMYREGCSLSDAEFSEFIQLASTLRETLDIMSRISELAHSAWAV